MSAPGNRGDDAPAGSDLGGDPVCWLSQVCPECGLFVESAPPAVCGRCGASIPAHEDAV